MNESQPSAKRTGFYPASARDYLEPLQLLKGWVDHLIFCDLNHVPPDRMHLAAIRDTVTKENLPEASFLLGDAISALAIIKPVDLFFVRHDSCGEGGSALALLHKDHIRLVLNVIKPGGLLVVDKPNGYLWLTRMLSGNSPQYPVDERTLSLSETQPWADNNLYSVLVA